MTPAPPFTRMARGQHVVWIEHIAAIRFAQGYRRAVVGAPLPPDGSGSRRPWDVATLVGSARQRGVVGYVGEGTSRWPALQVSDAALLAQLAVESAPAGSVLHAVADEGVAFRDIAVAMGTLWVSRRCRWRRQTPTSTSPSWAASSPWTVAPIPPPPENCSDGADWAEPARGPQTGPTTARHKRGRWSPGEGLDRRDRCAAPERVAMRGNAT
jgi:hypothetical protein